MKKILLILVLGLTLFSCKKEVIEPNVPIQKEDILTMNCTDDGGKHIWIHYTSVNGESKYIDTNIVGSEFKFSLKDVNRDSTLFLSSQFNYVNTTGNNYLYLYNFYLNDEFIEGFYANSNTGIEFYLN